MTIRLYDSQSRQKDDLPPPPGPIGMYFCGPTVYQRIHIGNARPFVLSMWLKRWLEHRGYTVKLAENVTDINDKIYDAARPLGIGSAELARRATGWYVEDTDGLGLGRPDVEPLASETVGEIVALTQELIARGLAYESKGDVYFRVARFPEYGRLSGARAEEMAAQEPGQIKEDPRDFALWKGWKPTEDTWWDSPWGRGRPGWHIECSAMAEKHLGAGFDVHGGGLDLRFPHHENELAQSRGAGRPFARTWMHNGMIELGAEKMSKSIGNIVSLREALDRWGREAILVFFLGGPLPEPARVLRGHDAGGASPGRGLPPGFPRRRGAAERPHLGELCGCARRRLRHAPGARRAPRLAGRGPARPPRAWPRRVRARDRSGAGCRTARDAPACRGPAGGAGSPGLRGSRPAPGRDRAARL